MTKMMKPEVEVVRFNSADVIATSGDPITAAVNSDKTTQYYILGADANQFMKTTFFTEDRFYSLRYDPNMKQWETTMSSHDYTEISGYTTPYAWYDNNGRGWVTYNEPYKNYVNPATYYTPNN